MLGKINFLTALAALILFFLPWIDIRCSGQSAATQTGIQTITGGSTPREQNKVRSGVQVNLTPEQESLGTAPLVGVAFVYVVVAAIVFLIAIRTGTSRPAFIGGTLCALALLLLVLQTSMGFPGAKKLQQSLAHFTQNQGSDLALASVAAQNLELVPLPGLYIEMAALGIPTLILLNGLLDRLRKQS